MKKKVGTVVSDDLTRATSAAMKLLVKHDDVVAVHVQDSSGAEFGHYVYVPASAGAEWYVHRKGPHCPHCGLVNAGRPKARIPAGMKDWGHSMSHGDLLLALTRRVEAKAGKKLPALKKAIGRVGKAAKRGPAPKMQRMALPDWLK